MGLGILIDVDNKSAVVCDCSISNECVSCKKCVCPGCSDKPVYICHFMFYCGDCAEKHLKGKVPLDTTVYLCVDDYFEMLDEHKAERQRDEYEEYEDDG